MIQFNSPALQFEHSVHESRHLPQLEASQQTMSNMSNYVTLQVLTGLYVCINYILLAQIHYIPLPRFAEQPLCRVQSQVIRPSACAASQG